MQAFLIPYPETRKNLLVFDINLDTAVHDHLEQCRFYTNSQNGEAVKLVLTKKKIILKYYKRKGYFSTEMCNF